MECKYCCVHSFVSYVHHWHIYGVLVINGPVLMSSCVVSGYTIPSSGLRIDFEEPPNSNLIATVLPNHIRETGLIQLNSTNVSDCLSIM